MRNSILLSVFMLAGLFATGQLSAQDSNVKACAGKSEKVSCVNAEKACAPSATTASTSSSPLVVQAAMSGNVTASSAKPGCQPANCHTAAKTASASCDPAECKTTSRTAANSPVQCQPVGGSAASVAQKVEMKEVKCQPVPVKTVVSRPKAQ